MLPLSPLFTAETASTLGVMEGSFPGKAAGDLIPFPMSPGRSCFSGNHCEWPKYKSANQSPLALWDFHIFTEPATAAALSAPTAPVWLLGFKLLPEPQQTGFSDLMHDARTFQLKLIPSNYKSLQDSFFFPVKPPEMCICFKNSILLRFNLPIKMHLLPIHLVTYSYTCIVFIMINIKNIYIILKCSLFPFSVSFPSLVLDNQRSAFCW